MQNAESYLGFFQKNTYKTEDENKVVKNNHQLVFYPITLNNGYTPSDFPHKDFSYGGIRFTSDKREILDPNEIQEGLCLNTIYSVTFDSAHYEYDPRNLQIKFFNLVLYDDSSSISDIISIHDIDINQLVHDEPGVWGIVMNTDGLYDDRIKLKPQCYALSQTPFISGEHSIMLYDEHSNLVSFPVNSHITGGRYCIEESNISDAYEPSAIIEKLCFYYKAGDWIDSTHSLDPEDSKSFEIYKLDTSSTCHNVKLTHTRNNFRLINKGITKPRPPISPVPPTPPDPPKPLADKNTFSVTQIKNFLIASGRTVQSADVINYCICITQGFITTFAGAPGTGKTTLCRLLAKAMGLQEEDGKNKDARYAEIAVERGWASLKDFIGYPDPFPQKGASKDTLIASNADACNAFLRMHENLTNKKFAPSNKPPYLMLLDEANLSPIEYYWAQFLRNCDLSLSQDDMAKRRIQVAKEPWQISPNLRFLATVNFDHTTEELSPRFLDRSWVITLDAPKEFTRTVGSSDIPGPDQPVTMQELVDAFGFSPNEKFPSELNDAWDNIIAVFRQDSVGLPLSPRNILAVERYCIAAARYVASGDITLIQALDFAVLQKILPTIAGYGTNYDNLIDGLLSAADAHGLTKTAERLTKMKAASENNSGFYQFFIR